MWGLVAAVWFGGVSVAWGLFFEHRAAERADAAQAQAFARRLAEVQQVAALGPLPPGPTVERDRLMADVGALAFDRFDEPGRKRARALLAHRLTSLGYAPELQSFPTGINIVGTRPSAPDAVEPRIVLVGAHVDTVEGSPGANDNASGLAVALEMARLFQAPTRHALRIVLFDQEEQGLAGSVAFARSPARTEGLRAAIVLEMLGATCRTPGCQRFPPGLPMPAPSTTGDFLAAVANDADPALLPLFVRAARPGLPPVFGLPVLDAGAAMPDTRRSDHAPFWDRGLPAIMLTDTADLRSDRYHQTTDTLAGIDADFLAGNAQTVANALATLLNEPPPPP